MSSEILSVLEYMEKEKGIASGLAVREVKRRRKVDEWFEFLEALARKTTFSERLTLDGLISVWHPEMR